jgi:hypothetical protein
MSDKLAVEWRPLSFDEVFGQSGRNNPEEKKKNINDGIY